MKKIFLLSILICLNVEASLSKFSITMDDQCPQDPCLAQKWANIHVVEIAKKSYEKINKNWEYIGVGELPSTESEYWDRAIIEVQERRCYTLARSKKPGTNREALEDLISKPAKLECLNALVAVKLLATAEILGNRFEDFVKWFEKVIVPQYRVKKEEIFAEMSLYCWQENKSTQLKPGAIHYFNNISEYGQIKNGIALGHNAICVGNDQYMAFCGGCKNGSVSKEMIFEELRQDFFSEINIRSGRENQHTKLCDLYVEKQKYYSLCNEFQKNKKPFYFNIDSVRDFLK